MAKLGELYKITSGGTPSRTHSEYYEDGTIPWVKTGDLKDKYLFETDEKISQLGLENSSARIYLKNTVLLAMYGATIGATSILKIDAATNQACAAFSPREDVLPEYLYAFLESQKDRFTKDAVGGAQPNLSAGYLKNIEFGYPPLEQQIKITSTLNKIDELLLLRKQQIAKLDELIKARFVEMFGEPSSNPMGWLQTTVGAECYYIKDGPHKSLTDVGMGNGYPFISVRNIVNGYIDFSTAKYISEADYKDAIKKCCPEKGDILYSKGGTTGIAKLVDIDIKFANWVHLAVLKFNHNEFNGSFFEKMLNCDYCYKQSQMLTKGIANRDLVLSAMAQIKIYKPPILLQNQFATFVERVDQQKQTVQQSLEKLELMKKALMQEYFG